MEITRAKRSILAPLIALSGTWVIFMIAGYIGMIAPDVYWREDGPVYPEPYVEVEQYLYLLGIALFAIVAMLSLKDAVALRVVWDRPLSKAAHRFNNLAVILSLVAGAVFGIGSFFGAWRSFDPTEEPLLIRIANAYLPIILATALVVFVLLQAFVFRKDAPDIPEGQKDEERAKLQRAIGLAYAAPIIGTAIAIIFGLTVYDITRTSLDTWIWVVIQAIIAISIILGTRFASQARSARALPPRERRTGVAAVNVNFVLSIVFGVVVLAMAFTLGMEAINNLIYWPEWREGATDMELQRQLLEPSIGWFVSDMLPAMILLVLAEFGIYRTLVIRNEAASR